MADLFGLDFGTTTTLAARVVAPDGTARVIDYPDTTGAPHPSVVAFQGDRVLVGRGAYELLDRADTGVIGNAVRSPKSYLGTGSRLTVGGVAREPRELASYIIDHVVNSARESEAPTPERTFDQAVMTIPVDMDGRGRRELREAARSAGLHVHQFVHEPLAALYAYLRGGRGLEANLAALGNSPVLVVDWGGGTLDLTLCRAFGDTLVQFASRGEHRVGGDRFDERLRNAVLHEHAAEHGLTALEPQVGAPARLLTRCELIKKQLSEQDDALLYVANYLAAEGPERDLEVEITKTRLQDLVADLVDIAMGGISDLLEDNRVPDIELGLVLVTGGMSRMPLIRNTLQRRFGLERVPVVENADRLIAHGAAWIAWDRRRLQLAKPFELILADDHPAELLPAGTELPTDDLRFPERFPVHCVDPRDARARFILTRPRDPGRAQPLDRRWNYGTLLLPVKSDLGPLDERLDLDVVVDSDLIVTVIAHSQLTGNRVVREIHELEFGLGIGPARDD